MRKIILLVAAVLVVVGCTINYKFTSASLSADMKTFSVDLFPNRALLVNPSLSHQFTEGMKDFFLGQTRLDVVKRNADLHFEGEITGYTLTPMAIQANAISAETRLTMKVNVRYFNKKDPDQDFESSFSAYADFETTESFIVVEGTLVEQILEQIYEDIFNKSVANW